MRYLLELPGVAVFAVGGGTLRDLLLDRHPIFWIANTTHLWVILGATAVMLAYVRFWIATQRALLVADALGLVFFTMTRVDVLPRCLYIRGSERFPTPYRGGLHGKATPLPRCRPELRFRGTRNDG